MASMIFRRRDFDPDTGNNIPTPPGASFCKTGQRRLYFTEQGLEYEQPIDDTDDNGSPADSTPVNPIRIVDMGLGNLIAGVRSVNIGGGFNGTSGTENEISAPDSVIIGGRSNTVNSNGSVVLGGENNVADASYSVILGGAGVTANVQNAAFAQRLHVTEYIKLPVYASTNDRDTAISSPTAGMLVFVNDTPEIYDGADWRIVDLGSVTP